MESAIMSLGALAVLVTVGWVIELHVHREPPTRMERPIASQIQRSAAVIGGGREV